MTVLNQIGTSIIKTTDRKNLKVKSTKGDEL